MIAETSKFKDITILYKSGDDQGFAIAKGLYDESPAVCCRWYNKDTIGYPQTHGKPTWFLMEDSIGKLLETALMVSKLFKSVV